MSEADALVRLEKVSRVYGRGEAAAVALDEASLAIERRSWVAVVGPSGHGKSTMLHLMGALDRSTSGKIHLDGEELSRLSARRLATVRARKIGFVFQFFNLLPHLTALENVQTALWFGGWPASRARGKGLDLLDQVGLADRTGHLPGQLSGGQQQRVALARALANDPDLLLLDEPTGNLDSTAEADVLDRLAALHRQGRTLVMVTHSPAVAARAERLVSVRDGRIAADAAVERAGA
jgi:putative ABC transport system ATP-binding protein